MLMRKPRALSDPIAMFSIGEYIVRAGAMVEQTFGGITTRLWDDPFEWTLPEKLNSHEAILEYLAEVESTRLKGFGAFGSDRDLERRFPAPTVLTSLGELLLATLTRSSHFQGRAFAVFQMLSDQKLPRV